MRKIAFAAVIAAVIATPAVADLRPWYGTWQGICEIAPAYRGTSTLPTSLTIGPSEGGRHTW